MLHEGSRCHDLPCFCAPSSASKSMLQQLLQQPAAARDDPGSGASNVLLSSASQHRTLLSLVSLSPQQLHPQAHVGWRTPASPHGQGRGLGATVGSNWRAQQHADISAASSDGTGRRPGTQSLPTSRQASRQQLKLRAAVSSSEVAGGTSGQMSTSPLAGLGTGPSWVLWSQIGPPQSLSGDAASTFVFCSVVLPKAR
jgi:hypothetical protein